MNFLMEISLLLTSFLLLLLFDVPVVKSQTVTFSISSSAKIGDSAQFFCNATTTEPQYDAYFMHNDNQISKAIASYVRGQSSSNISVTGSGNQYYYKYSISSLSCSDRGNYRCYVVNQNSDLFKTNSVTLDVLGPAGTPDLTAPSNNQILNDIVTVFARVTLEVLHRNYTFVLAIPALNQTHQLNRSISAFSHKLQA
ncbi:uncharacterized protein LOC118766837 [Octopus sinensis]|uniref:Uncharacterized protein LOC118766837 n=1 Tax=Octopus sinensis TaxID=2607531 RepID=A0A7E6FFS2_9MOLL|nr:uncharacterized protein LOC118766837 [Octopus sinensis]